MEMMMPGTTSPQAQTTVAVSQMTSRGQAGNAGPGFQQALVQQIAGQPGNEGNSEQQASPVAIVSQLASMAGGEQHAQAPAPEELMAAIDDLIDRLSEANESDEPMTEQKVDELNAALEGLGALLALLGVPVVNLRNQVGQMSNEESSGQLREAAASVKNSLQDALLQLQAKLQQGSLKQVQGQDPHSLIGDQLRSLAAAMQNASRSTETTTAQEAKNLPDWLIAQQAGVKETHAQLQRLSQQTVHPAFIQAIAELKAAHADGQVLTETQQTAGESVPGVQLPFVNPDQVRDFASLLSKSAPSAFVLADDFADTMEGLIVQKFDIRTLNGTTEAKLMLFPEHLGQVDVKITVQNGLLTAVFQADNAMAKDMLENQMAQLRAALQAQGLNVDKLEVTQSSSAAQLAGGPFTGDPNNGRQFDDRQGSRDDERVTDKAFEAEMVEQAAIQGLGVGRSINETA